MLFIGEDDIKKEIYNLKDTNTAEEETLSFERVVSRIKDRRRKNSVDDLV